VENKPHKGSYVISLYHRDAHTFPHCRKVYKTNGHEMAEIWLKQKMRGNIKNNTTFAKGEQLVKNAAKCCVMLRNTKFLCEMLRYVTLCCEMLRYAVKYERGCISQEFL
jgi:hypothetical protein